MIGVIIQARLGSTRFPRKILEEINGKSCLERVCHNVADAKIPHRVILAMPKKDEEDLQKGVLGGELFNDPPLRQMDEVIKRLRVDGVYFGDEENVLSRYYEAAKYYGLDVIVRVTADCPLICPDMIDHMLQEYLKRRHLHDIVIQNRRILGEKYTVVENISGFDVQICNWRMLADAHANASNKDDLEHVFPYMIRKFGCSNITQLFRMQNMIDTEKYNKLSFDTPEDLENIKRYMKDKCIE